MLGVGTPYFQTKPHFSIQAFAVLRIRTTLKLTFAVSWRKSRDAVLLREGGGKTRENLPRVILNGETKVRGIPRSPDTPMVMNGVQLGAFPCLSSGLPIFLSGCSELVVFCALSHQGFACCRISGFPALWVSHQVDTNYFTVHHCNLLQQIATYFAETDQSVDSWSQQIHYLRWPDVLEPPLVYYGIVYFCRLDAYYLATYHWHFFPAFWKWKQLLLIQNTCNYERVCFWSFIIFSCQLQTLFQGTSP